MKRMWLLISIFVCFISVSCVTVEQYPKFITVIKPGVPNEWIREDISQSNASGVLYTQTVPLDARTAALITVGKINNMLVSQIIITIQSYYSVSYSCILLENKEFYGKEEPGGLFSNATFITIVDPTNFIKTLQQQKTYNAQLRLNMDIYKCVVNGNLEVF